MPHPAGDHASKCCGSRQPLRRRRRLRGARRCKSRRAAPPPGEKESPSYAFVFGATGLFRNSFTFVGRTHDTSAARQTQYLNMNTTPPWLRARVATVLLLLLPVAVFA